MSKVKLPGLQRFLLQSTIFWFVLWLFSVLNNLQIYMANDTQFSWRLFFSWNFPYYFTMGLTCPLIYLLYHARQQTDYLSQFVHHLIAALILALVQQLGLNLYIVLADPMQIYEADTTFFDRLLSTYDNGLWLSTMGFLFYLLGLGLILFLDIYHRLRQKEKDHSALETALSKAKFDTLQSQLQPHFLFNTFNSLSMMARQEKHKEVVHMVAMMGNLLRETLNLGDQQQVTLEKEIELVNHYLSIEQIRFRDSLHVSVEVTEKAKAHLVPVLFLQPIVENAFRHGISKSENRATLIISALVRENTLVIRISNTGPLLPADWSLEEDMGIGLNNVLQRLDHAFGNAYTFTLKNLEDETGVVTEILVPLD